MITARRVEFYSTTGVQARSELDGRGPGDVMEESLSVPFEFSSSSLTAAVNRVVCSWNVKMFLSRMCSVVVRRSSRVLLKSYTAVRV